MNFSDNKDDKAETQGRLVERKDDAVCLLLHQKMGGEIPWTVYYAYQLIKLATTVTY